MRRQPEIVAATDLSASSMQAVERGFLLAKGLGGSLTVVHALGLDDLGMIQQFLSEDTDRLSKVITSETRHQLQALLAPMEAKHGIQAVIQIQTGQPTQSIPAFVSHQQSQLLVLGAHGKGFFQRLLLGSTASNLLKKSSVPVLAVKKPATGVYQNIMIAVDFSDSNPKMIRVARQLFPSAHFHFLHVYDLPFEGKLRLAGVNDEDIHQYRDSASRGAMIQLHNMALEAGLDKWESSGMVINGDPTLEIIRHEQKLNIDLIVMGKRGLHLTEELLLGSVTKRVLAESAGDVLVVVPDAIKD